MKNTPKVAPARNFGRPASRPDFRKPLPAPLRFAVINLPICPPLPARGSAARPLLLRSSINYYAALSTSPRCYRAGAAPGPVETTMMDLSGRLLLTRQLRAAGKA